MNFHIKDTDFKKSQKLGGQHWYSARLIRFQQDGRDWILKDYSHTPFFFCHTVGRCYTAHEFKTLRLLGDIPGVPRRFFRHGRFALGYEFVPGLDLKKMRRAGRRTGKQFFFECEAILKAMHQKGVIHFDLRNGENIVCSDHGAPLFLDFQSALHIPWWTPKFLRSLLEQIDLSGLYKQWHKMAPETMSNSQNEVLRRMNKASQLWVINKSKLLSSIHRFFNNKGLRKTVTRLRAPLMIALFIGVVLTADKNLFWPALAVSLFGEAIQLWCFGALAKQKKLARQGLYAVVRNPMYIGRFFLILGFILLFGNLWITLGYVIIYYFYMVNRVKREEATLSAIFGEAYQTYCNEVGSFFPRRLTRESLKQVPCFTFENFFKNHGHWNLLGVLAAWLVVFLYLFLA